MKKQERYIGGFAAVNQGKICDSYSIVHIENKNCIAGGFVGQNEGTIEHSYSDTKLKTLTGGFYGTGKNPDQSCYFFHEENDNKKHIDKLPDREYAKHKKEIRSEDDVEKLSYDIEKIWEYNRTTPIIKFQNKKWIYDTDELFEKADPEEIVRIETADELFKFAKHVNVGNIIYREAYVRIEKNIDLGGKEWTPIGETLKNSFRGVIDGCGHTISNFTIKNPDVKNKGFVAYLQGSIYNLVVDCEIQGDGCIGGLVAQNLEGTIGCCAAVTSIKKKKDNNKEDLRIGGLVGFNTGNIFQSYAAGHTSLVAIIIHWSFIGIILGLIAFLITFILFNIPSVLPDIAPIFNKIPDDLKQVAIEDDDATPREDSNFVSFQFNKEVEIDLDTGFCTLDYKNPGDSNHNTIVELQITDNVAKEAMGGTGRTPELQAEYEARTDYDPEAYRVVLAESDSISPGFQVAALSLSDYALEHMAPGSYDAVIMIYPYDMRTNNKAMLESQLPVTIVVR